MMRGVWTIAAREVHSLFRLPVGWIVVALYAFLSATVFVQTTLVPGAPATMRYFFTAAAWMMVPVAPAISMRLFSEEARSGTIEMLRTSPVGDFAAALGKHLGAWIFLAIMLAPTLVLPLTLAVVADPRPDPGPVLAGYLTLFLVGGLYLGIGMLASALTSSQTLAFLGTLMSIALLLMLTSLAGPLGTVAGPRVQELAAAFSVIARVSDLAKGVLDTAAIAFFLIATAWLIVITAGVLESRRLSRPRPVTLGLWAGFVLATGASAVFLGVLAHDYRWRADVTSTGAHRLSPRAERMVDLIERPTELVFAVDLNATDRRAVDLVIDVLAAYERRSDLLTLRVIDLGSAADAGRTDDLLSVLASRETDRIARTNEALRDAARALLASAEATEALARELDSVRDAIGPSDPGAATNRAYFDQRSGLARLGVRTLTEQAQAITGAMDNPRGPAGLAQSDQLTPQTVTVWNAHRSQLAELAEQAAAFGASEIAGHNTGLLARTAADTAGRLRDDAARAEERLTRLPRLDTLRVAKALETGESLLVIGPPDQGVAAVDLEALLPPTELLERAGLSAAGVVGPRAQELIATAIGRLVRPERPIVVFTHAQSDGSLFNPNGAFNRVRDRLREREIDSIEWAALEQVDPPDLARLDPGGLRPAVFMVVSPDSTAGSSAGGPTGAQRARDLANAVQRLIDTGRPVLLNLNPSIYPTYGDTDPLAALAAPFGIEPKTGFALLRADPAARVADPMLNAVPGGGEHPIAGALRGLTTVLPWATPIDLAPAPNAESWPVLTIGGEQAESVWAESRWLRFWSTPAEARPMLTDQPAFDLGEDRRADAWTIAAAGQRRSAFGESRLIVVGSNAWASDAAVTGAVRLVDGRVTTRFPGNAVMLDAAVHWLAGLDELIAPGAEARPVATVKPLNGEQLSTIRWILLGVVPGLVLLTGAAVRGLRG